MPYRLEFRPGARRQLRRLPDRIQVRLAPTVDAMAEEPRPPGASRLVGPDDLWRIRVGDYRIVYRIDDGERSVTIVAIGHRRGVYRDLPRRS